MPFLRKILSLDFILSRKSTEERFVVVFLAAIIGVFFMLLMLYLEGNLYFIGELDFGLLKASHLLLLSLPVAAVLWLYRNYDKNIDHEFLSKTIEKDSIFKTIELQDNQISKLLNLELELGGIRLESSDSVPLIAQICVHMSEYTFKTGTNSNCRTVKDLLTIAMKYDAKELHFVGVDEWDEKIMRKGKNHAYPVVAQACTVDRGT